jgi:N-acetylneuraminic acid mutarotase
MKNYHNCRNPIKLTIGSVHRGTESLATWAFAAAIGALFTAMPASADNQIVSGSVPAVVANLQPIGQLDGGQELRFSFGLPLRNQEGLEALIQQLYDPGSTNFHQYLTPAQFTANFGPTEQDYQAVVAFAQANNLTVTYEHSNRVILDVTGTVADIESALHVNMFVYQHPTEARTFYAPDVEPSLDLTVPIQGIEGLNNYALPQPNCTATPLGSAGNAVNGSGQPAGLVESGGDTNNALAQPNSIATSLGNAGNAMPDAFDGSGPGGTYWGYDFRDAYLPGVTLKGSNQLVGLVEFDGYTTSNIIYYETFRSPPLPNVLLTNVLLDGFNGHPSGTIDSLEVTLDIDMAISMAPFLSEVIVYEAPAGGWHDLLSRMADDNLATQLSCSWYLPDVYADPVAEGIFEQMAAQGQSFFCSSGDFDAHPPGTGFYFPEDSPHITLVGGTTLTTSGPGGSWVTEAVWNWNYAAGCSNVANMGSDGGISTSYAIPSWQTGVSMSGNQGSTTMRNVPDVALTADEVFVYTNGVNNCVAGTSCAAPLWAGFTALVNEEAAINGKPPVGFLNPALYAIGEGSGYSSDFHDITTGYNTSSGSPTHFYAVTGFDLCTGWGTPAGQSLINDLSSAGSCLFTNAGNLNTARRFQTAVLLPDGLVLAAGGYGSTYLASAEIYNPASGEWTNTRSMSIAVTQQKGLLLPNGLVLVAGGQSSSPLSVTNSQLFYPESATWTNTGPLNTAREYHTLTLLPNGLVLAAAGADLNGEGTQLSTAELFDPETGTWTNTGSLSVACQNHTATVLPSGLVLVAGGLDGGTALTNAELYNPETGIWTNTGPLNTARGTHTATLLPNGLVLVAGGENTSGNAITNAELYNPATGTWTMTGSMNVARINHTATLLPDGLVLVDGGDNGGEGISDAELYDPGTGTWTTTCSLNAARWGQSATLLPDGSVLTAGGYSGSASLPSSELSPAPLPDTEFLYGSSMTPARSVHTATLLPDGLVLVAGGYNYPMLSLSNADLYNPGTGMWTNTGSLNTARDFHTATLLPNDLVLVAGGLDTTEGEGVTLSSAELYSPVTGVWTDTGSLNTDRVWHTSTLLPDGLVLVAGGESGSGVTPSAELYNPATGMWTNTGSLHTARLYHTATLLPTGLVLVAGGEDTTGYTASAELYYPATGMWTNTGSLYTARAWHTAALLPNGLVLVAGGENRSGIIPSAELYNPFTGMWTNTGSLYTAREYHTSTLLPTGLVVVAGGYDGDGALASAELYNPASGMWSTNVGSLNTGRYYHTATLLPSGFVIVAGGNDTDGDYLGSGELFYP